MIINNCKDLFMKTLNAPFFVSGKSRKTKSRTRVGEEIENEGGGVKTARH